MSLPGFIGTNKIFFGKELEVPMESVRSISRHLLHHRISRRRENNHQLFF